MSLVKIQNELKAPKSQFNKFGKYNYRNCEDILEAVKPLLLKYDAQLTVYDELVLVGNRYYIRATASLIIGEHLIDNTAFARESETKKGMDDSQITGTASSYARKYALNGLFLIDDTKDADSMDNSKPQPKPVRAKPDYELTLEHESKMLEGIRSGEKTPKIILDNLEKAFNVSDEIKVKIKGMK